MDLTDINVIKGLLKKYGFNLSKGLGQNFLTDPAICPEMARLCGADTNTGVLEIGPGIGVLTKELAKTAKKVVSVEIDKRLVPVLSETLSPFNNITVIEGDVLKLDLKKVFDDHFKDMPVVVCANIPYYITSPIVMSLLESRLPFESVTVMVQKETALRFCAEPGTREAGAVTAAVHYYASPKMLFDVYRDSFMPSPNVESAVIRLDLFKEPPVKVHNETVFFRVIQSAFGQRRKTIYNSISSGMPVSKEKLEKVLNEYGISQKTRAEELTLQQFADIANGIG